MKFIREIAGKIHYFRPTRSRGAWYMKELSTGALFSLNYDAKYRLKQILGVIKVSGYKQI